MSARSTRFERATDLFRSGLDDANDPVIVVHDRSVADDGGGIAVMIDNARL